MKKFEIPEHYRSGTIAKVKEWRKQRDPRKKDFEPTVLDLGPVEFVLPRHFGFCYGVENAIEISYKAISENPGKRIYLLSQMIHNPAVNDDLESRGIRFIMDTEGNQLISWSEVTSDDVVIIPAFGTTLEIEALLKEKGVVTSIYNTTCPFVEKVWKRSAEIGTKGYTIIIHGKYKHEETRATFSHSSANAPSIVIRDMKEAAALADFVEGKRPLAEFEAQFGKRVSKHFDITKDLDKVGVVNQTTMLATETQEIADFFKQIMLAKYGEEAYKEHFADTRDTLCYATNDNQEATVQVLGRKSDLALVIGGYNSSNTSQLVTILQREMPVYYISGVEEIVSNEEIRHVVYGNPEAKSTANWLPKDKEKLRIVLTSGASCPDAIVEAVMLRVLSFFPEKHEIQKVLDELMEA
jgi:4-hydroxy-3-methylbut-2-enyl diphosphate reductase